MRILLLLPLLLTYASFGQTSDEDSLIRLTDAKWSRSRQTPEKPEDLNTGPAHAMTRANRNFQRNARVDTTRGANDPNEFTLDSRSAAIEKNVQDSRSPKADPADGFSYRVNLLNNHKTAAEIVFWEFHFTEIANPSNIVRRKFLCAMKVKPGQKRELQAFSLLGPSDVVSVETLAVGGAELFSEAVLINRVEFADGSILQKKDWNFAEEKARIQRVLATPWRNEVCRVL